MGIAFSPNTTIAYVAAILGGIANSFLDTATYPAVAEIINKYTGIATMGIKLFISVAQLLMPFFLGVVAGTSLSYLMLPVVAGVCIGILGILAIFAPFPASSESGKSESLISNIKECTFLYRECCFDPDRIHKYSNIPVMVKLCTDIWY